MTEPRINQDALQCVEELCNTVQREVSEAAVCDSIDGAVGGLLHAEEQARALHELVRAHLMIQRTIQNGR